MVARAQLVARVFELAGREWPQAAIAAEVGRSQSTVSRILKAGPDAVSPRARVVVDALERRRQQNEAEVLEGPKTLLWRLHQAGIAEDDLPSFDTVARAIRRAGLRYMGSGGRGDRRRYHNFFLDDQGMHRITGPCQRFEFDFYGPLTIAGQQWYIACLIDVYSRYMYAEVVDHQFGAHIVAFFERAIADMGIPEEIQVDNAFGIRLNDGMPSKSTKRLFELGVQRLHFIPPFLAEKNGHVERQNGTQYTEFWGALQYRNDDGSYNWASIDACRADFAFWLLNYNHKRQHRGLPKRASKRRMFHQTPAEVHEIVLHRECHPRGGEIAFTRLMSNQGWASAHGSYTLVLPEYAARYVTWVAYGDGSGECLHGGKVVGTFTHFIGVRSIRKGDKVLIRACVAGAEVPDVTAPINQSRHERKLQKGLKKTRRPIASMVPPGLKLVDGHTWDRWALVDIATSDVVLSASDGDADHSDEEIVFEYKQERPARKPVTRQSAARPSCARTAAAAQSGSAGDPASGAGVPVVAGRV